MVGISLQFHCLTLSPTLLLALSFIIGNSPCGARHALMQCISSCFLFPLDQLKEKHFAADFFFSSETLEKKATQVKWGSSMTSKSRRSCQKLAQFFATREANLPKTHFFAHYQNCCFISRHKKPNATIPTFISVPVPATIVDEIHECLYCTMLFPPLRT